MHGSRLTLMRGGAMYLSTGERVVDHATQAWKVAIALDGVVSAELATGDVTGDVVVVPPFATQAMHGSGPIAAFFAEPGSDFAPFAPAGTAVARPWVPDRRTREALVALAREGLDVPASQDPDVARAVFGQLRVEGPRRVDARVEHALRASAADPDCDVEAVALARRVSTSRLRHLVTLETGLVLRTHRLWHRTLLAVESMLGGTPIARAALDAGFADHAHFTRAFTRFFGRSPSSLRTSAHLLASYGERDASVPSRAVRDALASR